MEGSGGGSMSHSATMLVLWSCFDIMVCIKINIDLQLRFWHGVPETFAIS